MKFILISAAFIFLFFPSCKYFKTEKLVVDEKPVARVGDSYLYYSDIQPLLKNPGGQDSASIVKGYVDEWIKQKLMIQKALLYLPADKLDIDRQVNDYRESLILYAYERELIIQKLDTVVREEELLKYFDEYRRNFELRDDVVQMHYVKTAIDAPKLDSLKIWIGSKNDLDKVKLEDYCFQYATDFSLSDSIWFEVQMVNQNIPVRREQLDAASRDNKPVALTDSLFNYVIKVNVFENKGEVAPFDFVKDDITRIILNKRKMNLVRETYENLYKEAESNTEFEIYR